MQARYFSTILVILLALPAAAEDVRFDRDVRPILADKCYFCHGPDAEHRQADLRLDLEEEAREAVGAGDPQSSELILRILASDPAEIMPPPDAHKELSNQEIEVLTDWVRQGAVWSKHWAFEAPQANGKIEKPSVDAFVKAKLAEHSLELLSEASREKLIRRVTFDLTGLPPTIEEIDRFLADDSPQAYEFLVDRLLASPRYGQRMAVMWLDAARYGDTSVYHADGNRDMWAWRDAIVDAYNSNMPFDQFSINQLAGDLIPDATFQQQLLSGFNRNNGTTDEGGAIAEEYRVEYAVDRVRTTSTVWMGLTMECAQCHDHKYDPISHEEYYQFYAYFNVSSDAGMQTRNGNAEPKLDIPVPQKEQRLADVAKKRAHVEQELKKVSEQSKPDYEAWLKARQAGERTLAALPSGSIVQLTLNEGEGTDVEDLLNPDIHGQVIGNAVWVDSREDMGFQFDGSSYIDLKDVGNFERTDSFSYGGWIQPQKGASGALLARMDDKNAHRGYDVLVGDGVISVHLIHTWPTNAVKVVSKKKLKAAEWQHVFVTYDGSSKAAGVKIYVNGDEWEWVIEQDRLSESIQTDKTLFVGSRNPGARWKGIVDEISVFNRCLNSDEIKAVMGHSAIESLLAIDPAERSEQQNQTLRKFFLSTENEAYQEFEKQLAGLEAERTEIEKPLTSVMVMSNMEKPRDTFVLNRGAYDAPTEVKVQPGTLAVLPPMAADAPANRLGLANWLFREDHPLTARVAVNRYWQMLFGRGLVGTPEDFGAQGEYPSHPELLDWLAVDFRESGWDVKRFIKQLVMSETYRQTSGAGLESYQRDPENRLFARGARFRLQGEFIRDNALAISGLLNESFGGPGVKPYQPPGLWVEVGLSGKPSFVQDHADKLYRRSLYTYWKRSAPPPSMQIFDAPTREVCVIRRARTNTPLQAFVTLNDPQFVEAARHFAERILVEGGNSPETKMEFAFRTVTARKMEDQDRNVLEEVLRGAREHYAANPDAAKELVSIGESVTQSELDLTEHAAWTTVASALLNLDETLTRE